MEQIHLVYRIQTGFLNGMQFNNLRIETAVSIIFFA